MEENAQGLEVYLFWNQEGKCMAVSQGMAEPPAPGLNYQLCYTPEDMGEKENYDLVNGIILRDVNGHCYAATWNDDEVNVCQMENWKKKEEPTVQTEDLEKEKCNPGEEKSSLKEHPAVRVRKIQRKDMVCLPRCEWKYANNSFLVHGYYNYHHLILTDRDGQLKLGVPGVYYPQEAKAAESFGFPEFLPVTDLDLELTEEEKNEQEQFGYWCRNVKGSWKCAEQDVKNKM